MKTRITMTALLLTGALGVLLALPAVGVAADSANKAIESVAADAATTPEQHKALAASYRQKAAEERAEVAKHRDMANSFVSRSPNGQAAMRAHCAALADAAAKAATEYDAMAKLQDEEAAAAAAK